MRCLLRILFTLVLACASARSAFAHSMYQGAVLLDFHPHTVDMELQLPASRVASLVGVPATPSSLPALQAALAPYLRTHLHVQGASGPAWQLDQEGPAAWQTLDGAPYVVVHLHLTPPSDVSVRAFTLQSDVLTDRIPSQVMLVSVRSDWASSTFANDPDLLGILTSETRSIAVEREHGSWLSGFGSIFHLGLRHIAEGTDHILFLLALLLPAPLLARNGRWGGFAGVRHGLVTILKVVSAFTIGHSITLALASTGLVHVPSRPIEVLIAVSILVSAVHAMRPLFPGREPLVAGCFGFIHGLAFATTLAELGLHGAELAASILSFNLGIETMQLVVVLMIMPSLMLLSTTRLYPPFRIVGAVFAGAAATGWIVQRIFDLNLPVDAVVDRLAQHALEASALLFLLSVSAWWLSHLQHRHAASSAQGKARLL